MIKNVKYKRILILKNYNGDESMNNIIIYASCYGTNKMYANELSKETNIKAVFFEDIKDINIYNNIIYLGDLYACGLLGMKKTLKKLNNISNKNIILITVGLSDPKDEENIKNIRNNMKNQISKEIFENAKIFHLRGGIDYTKLKKSHKIMMKLLYNAVKKLPEEKKTAEDRAMIETYDKKINFVDFSNLKNIIDEIKN